MTALPARVLLASVLLVCIFGLLPPALAESGRRNLEAGNYNAASRHFYWAKRLSVRPPLEWSWLLGKAAHKNLELDLAIRAYREVISGNPQRSDVRLELARVYFVKGDPVAQRVAVAEATEELRLFPENDRAYYVRGLIYGGLKLWDEAERDFLAFIDRKPESPWAYNDLAWVYFSKGDWQRAEEASRRAIDIHNTFMWGYNGLGLALLNQGRYAEAVGTLEIALRLADEATPGDYLQAYPGNDPQFALQAPDAFRAGVAFNLGLSYIKIGNKERAIHALKRTAALLSTREIEKRVGISRSEVEQRILTIQQQ